MRTSLCILSNVADTRLLPVPSPLTGVRTAACLQGEASLFDCFKMVGAADAATAAVL